VDVYVSTGRHWLHTDVAIAILVGISANMLMVMVIVFHYHFQCKAWRATARGFACRKHGWNSELRE